MKSNCRTLKLSIIICTIFLISIIIFSILIMNDDNKLVNIILNISIGLFGSGCVSLLLYIPIYNVSKKKLLNDYFEEYCRILNIIFNIHYLSYDYDVKNTISYINILNNRKLLKELGLPDNLKNDTCVQSLIRDYKEKEKTKNNNSIEKYSDSQIIKIMDLNIDRMRKKAKEIFDDYILVSRENTIKLETLLNDMEFLSGRKKYEIILKNTYQPLNDILNRIKKVSSRFELLKIGEGNEAASLDMIFSIQKDLFEVDKKADDEYIVYIIHNKIYRDLVTNIYELFSKINDMNIFKPDILPVEWKTIKKYSR